MLTTILIVSLFNIALTFVTLFRVRSITSKDSQLLKKEEKPRKGWSEAFKKMHENGDDIILIP